MNSGTNDVTCYRAYLPDALRLRFEDNLSIRAIAQHLNLSHSTVHVLFQRFIASGIKWPLPETLSFTQLDQMLFTNRKKGNRPDTVPVDTGDAQWRKKRRTSYSREFKINLVKQALQPGAVVARIAREHGINDNMLFNWKNLYKNGLLNDDNMQEGLPVPVALTDTPEPAAPVTNPFWQNKNNESPVVENNNSPRCELHLASGVVKLFDPLTPEILRVLIHEMKGGSR
ncbi:IS66-like element accessory protein TnpA [Citrobacter freundii]|uniref:IS66-like element accessory protein TnpA n=1 Tax=Citrobacter freundii TaxID=546 RepID=UPI00300D4820